jgi:serine/threonine protein kinase/tetratricopeptide (TPR) repeat protein
VQQTPQSDELTMSLVERALARPQGERENYLYGACEGDSELFGRVWNYVQWEERMAGFLLDPFCPPAQSDCAFEPGQLLVSRFRVVREIARGGMGVVWEAFDERLERRVAIKFAKTGFGKQLPPEVRNAREIGHPNVCRLFEIHTTSGPQGEIDFISMEFLEGETLSERLRRGPMPKKECLRIALQVCSGLSEAHRHGVIHGDLKSNNVILTNGPDASNRAVIMDFGLARGKDSSGGNPSTDMLAGTPAYMAPELWKGVKPSVASDIYALGVILWELVSGLRPSDLGVTSSTLSWDERPTWRPPTGYGKWDRVVACCLQADPARRFQSAEEIARALGPSRAYRWGLVIAAALVMAIGTGAIAYWRAAPPQNIVSLVMRPLESRPESAALADKLFRNTSEQIAHLHGDVRTKLTVSTQSPTLIDRITELTWRRHSSTTRYILRGSLERDHSRTVVHAYLTDAHSGVNAKEWRAEYEPQELRHAPFALAGVVTETFHLPPLQGAPEINQAARQYLRQGRSWLRSDTTVDTAVASMSKAVAADPDSALAQAGLAEALWWLYHTTKDGKWLSRSIEAARRAEYWNPDLAEVHRVSGLLKVEAAFYPEAIAEYRRAIELEPGNAENYRRLGIVYGLNNQPDDSLESLRQAAELPNKDFRIYLDLGAYFFYRAEYGESVEQFRHGVELAPNEPRARFDLSNACINMGLFNEAEREIRASIRLQERANSLQTLGLVLMYEREEKAAIPFLLRATTLGPDEYVNWLNLGTCYRRTRQPAKARWANLRGLRAAELNIAKNPRHARVRSALAYLCVSLGDRSRAASDIAQALALSPNDANVQFLAVSTYECLHRRDDALAVLADAAAGMLADVNRWPDLADLRKDSRFLNLLAVRGIR